MKLISFQRHGGAGYGAVADDGIVDLTTVFGERWPDLKSALAGDGMAEIAGHCETAAPDFALADVTCDLPVAAPGKILCVGRNYAVYHEVADSKIPEWPSIFVRFADSFAAHGEPILRPRESEQLDFEGELALVIGRRVRHVAEADALDCIAGYTCCNEGSVRDWQRRGTQNTPGKNFYRSGGIGPWLVTADEIPDPSALTLTTRVNGEVRQRSGTGKMLFSIPYIIAHITKFTWLEPGDIIATGSPGGSAIDDDPPRWLKAGDTVEVEITGVGTLANPVAEEEAA